MSAAGPTVRPACLDDIDAVAALQTRAITAFGIDVYGEATCKAWAKIGVQVRHTLLESGTFFVAEQNGAIVGVAGWTADSREPDCAWPRYVFVEPAAGGAPVQNLSHSASFHEDEKSAPSKPGIKHLVECPQHLIPEGLGRKSFSHQQYAAKSMIH